MSLTSNYPLLTFLDAAQYLARGKVQLNQFRPFGNVCALYTVPGSCQLQRNRPPGNIRQYHRIDCTQARNNRITFNTGRRTGNGHALLVAGDFNKMVCGYALLGYCFS